MANKGRTIDDLSQKVGANAFFGDQVSSLEKEIEEIATNMFKLKDQHKVELMMTQEETESKILKF